MRHLPGISLTPTPLPSPLPDGISPSALDLGFVGDSFETRKNGVHPAGAANRTMLLPPWLNQSGRQ
jgi:hypothetical protein